MLQAMLVKVVIKQVMKAEKDSHPKRKLKGCDCCKK